jgi:hypothetical protein
MANVKITELTAATALAGTDVLPIVDVGADATKKVSVSDLLRNLPDGTASAPALAFADDQNTGVLSPGDNSLAFATSGTQRLVINSAGQIDINSNCRIEEDGLFKASNGSAAAPSHAFLNDPDNGMFRATTNTLGFSTGGSERLRIDSSGRLLLGTTTEGAAGADNLTVADSGTCGITIRSGTSSNGNIYFSDATSGTGEFAGYIQYRHGDNALAFGDSSAERVRIDSSGRVGIGTSSPTELLHIRKDAAAVVAIKAQNASSNGIMEYQAGNDADNWFFGIGSDDAFGISDVTGQAGRRLTITQAGNVGIGETSPNKNLVVKKANGGGDVGIRIQNDSTNSSGTTASLRFTTSTNDTFDTGSIVVDRGTGAMIFSEGGTEAMRIDNQGNVAIGTSTIGNASLTLYGSGSRTMYQGSSTGTGNGNGFTTGNNGAADAFVWNYENGFMQFATNNTERMRIDNSGRLLVGTSSALDTTAGSIASNNSSSGGRLALGGNPSSAGSSVGEVFGWWNANKVAGLVIASGADTTNKDDGELLFYTSASGPSVQERMRIDSSGRLLVGTTSVLAGTGNTNSGLSFDSASANQLYVSNTTSDNIVVQSQVSSGTVNKIAFIYNSSVVARITCSSTQVNYNTGSDYRLKENVVDIIDGIARVKQLQPRRFNFIADADTTVDGFVAHEAQAVVPEAVTGTHNEVDDNGNAVMQGIDQSKLVPLLTAALQEAIAKIETLETKVAALEAQ